MCGRYTLIANAEAIRTLFNVPDFDERLVVPRYNIAPTQPIVVVRNGLRGGRELLPMRWGLIPGFVKDPKDSPLLIMARSDGIDEKPSFRHAFRRRRCLIPASGLYEWQDRGGRGPKQPYAIRPDAGGLIAFAGLWETWSGADGSEIDTAAIVTVPCNEKLRIIHERMPAIVSACDFDTWLAADTSVGEALSLLAPAADDLLDFTPVSTRVNAAGNDDAALLEPVIPKSIAPSEPRQGSLF